MDDRIILDPDIHHGKPVIRGTRVPVVRILAELADGMDEDDILREYEIRREDLLAVYRYAAEFLDREQVHPLPAA